MSLRNLTLENVAFILQSLIGNDHEVCCQFAALQVFETQTMPAVYGQDDPPFSFVTFTWVLEYLSSCCVATASFLLTCWELCSEDQHCFGAPGLIGAKISKCPVRTNPWLVIVMAFRTVRESTAGTQLNWTLDATYLVRDYPATVQVHQAVKQKLIVTRFYLNEAHRVCLVSQKFQSLEQGELENTRLMIGVIFQYCAVGEPTMVSILGFEGITAPSLIPLQLFRLAQCSASTSHVAVLLLDTRTRFEPQNPRGDTKIIRRVHAFSNQGPRKELLYNIDFLSPAVSSKWIRNLLKARSVTFAKQDQFEHQQ
ncbi:hypothetical protein C8R42DRAFT_647388 [Lentinula raphanica]|nr:hypothetical protein C8R42DRAFT_647388 [Lentinula raphanica]